MKPLFCSQIKINKKYFYCWFIFEFYLVGQPVQMAVGRIVLFYYSFKFIIIM